MSDAEKAYQATPASTLEEEIMNPCIAKNEREWWAAAEIERLNDIIQNMRYAEDEDKNRCVVENERLRAALRDLLDASERHIFSTECQKERDAARAALSQEPPNDR